MRKVITAITISLISIGSARAEVSEQILRDTIGRTCSLMVSHNDPAWIVKNAPDAARPLCKCAIDLSLKYGLNESHLNPSLYVSPRGLNKAGLKEVGERTLQCAKSLYRTGGPTFRPDPKPTYNPW